MVRSLMLGACAALFSATAFAQLPEPLEQALSAPVNDREAARIDMRIGVNNDRIMVRMVESETGDSDYTLLAPPEDTLNEAQRELWDDLLDDDEDENADEEGGFSAEDFDPEELRRIMGEDVSLLREEDGRLIYGFVPLAMPDSEGEPDRTEQRMLEAMQGEVHVNAANGHVQAFHLRLQESVKPNFAARIDGFQFLQDYVFDEAVNGPRLASLHFNIAGSAAFQSFDENMTIEILDIEWAAPAAGGPVVEAAESH